MSGSPVPLVVRWRKALWDHDGLSIYAKAVGAVLAQTMKPDGTPFRGVTQGHIAAKAGCSPRKVWDAINELEGGGWVKVKREAGQNWRRSQYKLEMPLSLAPGATESLAPDAKQLPRTNNNLETSTPSDAASPAGDLITVRTDDGPIEVEREWGGAASRLAVEWVTRYAWSKPDTPPSGCPWPGEMGIVKRVWPNVGPKNLHDALRGARLRADAGRLPGVTPGSAFGLCKVFGDPDEYEKNLKAGLTQPELSPDVLKIMAGVGVDPESVRRKEAQVA